MTKGPWIAELVAFGALGAAIAYLLSTRGDSTAILLFVFPVVAVSALLAFAGATGAVRKTLRSLRWWHWLWFLVFVSGLVFRIRDVGDISENPVDAWAMFRIALETVVGLTLLAQLSFRRTLWLPTLFRGLIGILSVYAIVSIVSTVWSVYPAWTLYKSIEYLVDVSLLAAILAIVTSTEKYRSLMSWTWLLYGLLVAWIWLGIILWPHDELMSGVGTLGVQLQGYFPAVAANSVGEYGAILAILGISRLLLRKENLSRKAFATLLLMLGLATAILAQTRSALAGLGLGVIVVLYLSRRFALSALLAAGAAGILSVQAVTGSLADFWARGESAQELQTFSSRLNWWQFAWQKFLESPVTGHGAYAAGRFLVMAELKVGSTASVHSDYVEILVGTGLIGLAPAILVVLGTWWALFRASRNPSLPIEERPYLVDAFGVLAVVTVRSIFTTDIFWHPPLMFLAILGYAELLRRKCKPQQSLNTRPVKRPTTQEKVLVST